MMERGSLHFPRDRRENRVTVVVLTHNRAHEVLRTIGHLARLPEAPTIIVMDNASSDGTSRQIAERYPAVQVLRMDTNMGAAARNAGIRHATTKYVALCDDDTWWTEGSLGLAADAMDRHAHVAVVTARVMVGPDRREDPTCRAMAESPLPRSADLPGPAILGFLAGASMVRRSALLEVGGFEPRFFLGGEEALVAYDLIEAGWSMLYLAEATVWHMPSPHRDSALRRRHLVRNALWLAWMRRPYASAWRETRRTLERLRTDPAVRNGFLEALKGLPWVWRRRRAISPPVETLVRMLDRSDGPRQVGRELSKQPAHR
ncbi:MAG TPA: glycosyltransferase [Nitrospira sp.]|nr:glycosyltransferase [Nitrospira sp.]